MLLYRASRGAATAFWAKVNARWRDHQARKASAPILSLSLDLNQTLLRFYCRSETFSAAVDYNRQISFIHNNPEEDGGPTVSLSSFGALWKLTGVCSAAVHSITGQCVDEERESCSLTSCFCRGLQPSGEDRHGAGGPALHQQDFQWSP